MALSGANVRPNPGTLTYTPDGGGDQAIGYTNDGVQLIVDWQHSPITPDELARVPLDYILAGGPVYCVVTALEWSAATQNAIAGYAISAAQLVLTTNDVGKKLTDLQFGTLAFAPTTTGHVQWTAGRAVPLINERNPFAPRFQKEVEVQWGVTFGLLPPTGGGTVLTLDESS